MQSVTNCVIDSSIAPTILGWIKAGRGVKVWECADLSSGKVGHRMFTPGDTETSPHWSYTLAGMLDTATAKVETFTPRETFNGTAKRRYWGMDLSDASRAKAERLKREVEVYFFTIQYDWGRTYCKVDIGTMALSPLI